MPSRSRKNALCRAGAVLAVPVLALLIADPSWGHVGGGEAGFDGYVNPEVENHSDEFRGMQAANEDVRHRIARKEVIITALRTGRMTLADAAAEFLAMNRDRPETMSVIRDTYPGDTDEERVARNVIAFALIRVPDPAAKRELAGRLDAELHALPRAYHPDAPAR